MKMMLKAFQCAVMPAILSFTKSSSVQPRTALQYSFGPQLGSSYVSQNSAFVGTLMFK